MPQFVFWRDTSGRPYRKGDDRYAQTRILEAIGSTTPVGAEEVGWRGFRALRYEAAIRPTIAVLGPDGEELNDQDAWTIISNAISAVIKHRGNKSALPGRFIKAANRGAAEFFARKPEHYVVVSSLTVTSLPTRSIRVNNSCITELRNREKRFPFPSRIAAEERHRRLLERSEGQVGKNICIKTTGRTIHDAMSRGMSDLTILRGLWTFACTYRTWPVNFFRTPHRGQLGVVHAGPVHTIHHPDGKAVDDVFWQEREFVEQVSPFTPSNGWTGIEKARKDIQRRLKSLPYQKEIEDVIFRYAVALDQTNLDVAFLQLWSILEKLTDSVGSNYDATINRAVSQFEDPKLASNMLHAIRLQRNRFVHAAQSGTELDQIGYMIKSFVDPHLLKLIQNSFQVDSLEEYGAFLALPTDLGALERQHRRTGRALRMRRSWAKQS